MHIQAWKQAPAQNDQRVESMESKDQAGCVGRQVELHELYACKDASIHYYKAKKSDASANKQPNERS